MDKVVYTGLFLDEPSQVRAMCVIQRHFGELLSKHYAHHLTLQFRPSRDFMLDLPHGRDERFEIIGYGGDDKAQAVLCWLPDHLPCGNPYPHVTIATSEDTKPVYSNHLLSQSHILLSRTITLVGRVGWFDGRTERFDFNEE